MLDDFILKQKQMIALLELRGISDTDVLQAMAQVPRHCFVAPSLRAQAYSDCALPIDCQQTISQPYIVALMMQALILTNSSKILEVGTGCGYQAACLAQICHQVYSIEIIEKLHHDANILLQSLGYKNIKLKLGDGHQGWDEFAPFDGIIVTAAAKQIPHKLVEQLKVDGLMVIPIEGKDHTQKLIRIIKTNLDCSYRLEELLNVKFVPLTGK